MGFLKKENYKHILLPYILSILLVSIFFVWFYNAYGVFYLSNDDTGIMKTYSGYTTGEPRAYHAYGSFTLGLVFKALYSIAPMINWYTYGSIFVMVLSNATIIACIYKMCFREESRLGYKYLDFGIIAILVLAIDLYGINRISWTMNALFAAVAGLMLLLVFLSAERRKYWVYIVCLCFFAASMLIRGASYKAVLPFAMVAIVCSAIKEINPPIISIRNAKKVGICLLLLIPLLAVYGYNKIDVAIKQSEFPSSESSFEHYRGLYTDSYHIPYEGNEEFYQSIGWDAEFYNMTRSWFFIDSRFNTENLKTIAEESAKQRTEVVNETGYASYWEDFKNATEENPVRKAMTVAIILLFLFGIGMFAYSLIIRKAWSDWLLLIASQGIAIAECIYLVVGRSRFIDRSFYCAALPALLIGIWIIAKETMYIKKRAILCLLSGCLAIWGMNLAVEQNVSVEASEQAEKASQISYDADSIYFNN